MTDLIERTRTYVERELAGEGSGHDYWHVHRVWKTAKAIGTIEGAEPTVTQLAALLHDIADYKLHGGDHEIGPRKAREWLTSQCVSSDVADHVIGIMRGLDYKGAGVVTVLPTIEGCVVHDADKLDAIGAIGIARAFAFGGHLGRPLYDPRIAPVRHESFEAYKASTATGTTLNHFHEKLLLLQDRMLTGTGKRLAQERHGYMVGFVDQFLKEWGADS